MIDFPSRYHRLLEGTTVWVFGESLNGLHPSLAGDNSKFGNEDFRPLPLPFDRVNGGQPPRSNAALFTLPYDILGLVLDYVSSNSLSALALVNRDCLQWARSRQFRSVKLDYSPASSDLVDKLWMENRERLSAGGMTAPSIGDCIRRITVASNPDWVYERLGIQLEPEVCGGLPKDKQRERMVDASKEFFDGYISIILDVMNISTTPHLEFLDWEDKTVLPHSFSKSIANLPIKHLKVYLIAVEEDIFAELPEACKDLEWPLQTLHIEKCSAFDISRKISTSPLTASILRLCSSTLRDLTLENRQGHDSLTFLDQKSKSTPCFPSLRNLSVGAGVQFEDASVLNALVQDNLRILNVGSEHNAVAEDFFRQRGRIPALVNFAWEPSVHPLDFLRANSQIKKLALPHANSSTLLHVTLLPLLSESFSNLTSLSLVWEGTSIPESSLEMVASLKTLEQLHLSSGNQHSMYDWFIEHQVMRKHLSKLSLLKKLAFSRDTYYTGPFWLLDYYQSRRLVGEDRPENLDDYDKLWEQKHSERVLNEAKHYVEQMVNLEWLYFGQIPMQVVGSQEASYRIPEPLDSERDSCWTLLRTMFGGIISLDWPGPLLRG